MFKLVILHQKETKILIRNHAKIFIDTIFATRSEIRKNQVPFGFVSFLSNLVVIQFLQFKVKPLVVQKLKKGLNVFSLLCTYKMAKITCGVDKSRCDAYVFKSRTSCTQPAITGQK